MTFKVYVIPGDFPGDIPLPLDPPITQERMDNTLREILERRVRYHQSLLDENQDDIDAAYRRGDGNGIVIYLALATIYTRIKELLETMLVEMNAKGGPSADETPPK